MYIADWYLRSVPASTCTAHVFVWLYTCEVYRCTYMYMYEDGEIDTACQLSTSQLKECAVVAEEQAQG